MLTYPSIPSLGDQLTTKDNKAAIVYYDLIHGIPFRECILNLKKTKLLYKLSWAKIRVSNDKAFCQNAV